MSETEFQISQEILTAVKQIQTTQFQQTATQTQQYKAIMAAIATLQASSSQNQLTLAEMFTEILLALNAQNTLLGKILTQVSQLPPVSGGVYFGTPIPQ